MAKIMPHVRHCCKMYPDVNELCAHCRCASDERLIIYNITRCYGKRVTVFAVAIAAGDIIKYQSFVYGSFVWEILVRYNNIKYQSFVNGSFVWGIQVRYNKYKYKLDGLYLL